MREIINEFNNSLVLKTMEQLKQDYIQKWVDLAPTVAYTVRDVAGLVFLNDMVGEEPTPELIMLVQNEIEYLVEQGKIVKVLDLHYYAHCSNYPGSEYYALN